MRDSDFEENATTKQLDALIRMGYNVRGPITKREAARLITGGRFDSHYAARAVRKTIQQEVVRGLWNAGVRRGWRYTITWGYSSSPGRVVHDIDPEKGRLVFCALVGQFYSSQDDIHRLTFEMFQPPPEGETLDPRPVEGYVLLKKEGVVRKVLSDGYGAELKSMLLSQRTYPGGPIFYFLPEGEYQKIFSPKSKEASSKELALEAYATPMRERKFCVSCGTVMLRAEYSRYGVPRIWGNIRWCRRCTELEKIHLRKPDLWCCRCGVHRTDKSLSVPTCISCGELAKAAGLRK